MSTASSAPNPQPPYLGAPVPLSPGELAGLPPLVANVRIAQRNREILAFWAASAGEVARRGQPPVRKHPNWTRFHEMAVRGQLHQLPAGTITSDLVSAVDLVGLRKAEGGARYPVLSAVAGGGEYHLLPPESIRPEHLNSDLGSRRAGESLLHEAARWGTIGNLINYVRAGGVKGMTDVSAELVSQPLVPDTPMLAQGVRRSPLQVLARAGKLASIQPEYLTEANLTYAAVGTDPAFHEAAASGDLRRLPADLLTAKTLALANAQGISVLQYAAQAGRLGEENIPVELLFTEEVLAIQTARAPLGLFGRAVNAAEAVLRPVTRPLSAPARLLSRSGAEVDKRWREEAEKSVVLSAWKSGAYQSPFKDLALSHVVEHMAGWMKAKQPAPEVPSPASPADEMGVI